VALQIKSNPQVFEDAARFAARTIRARIGDFGDKDSNEPALLRATARLELLYRGFRLDLRDLRSPWGKQGGGGRGRADKPI